MLLRVFCALCGELHFTFGHSLVLSQLGEAYLASGQQEKAREVAHRAIDLAVRVGEIGNAAWAHCLMAKVMNHEGKTSEMRRHYLAAQLLAGPAGMQPIEALCAAGEHVSSSSTRV